MRIPELLAPVGSPDHLKVATNAGASSVYLSGKNYGARKYASNFTLDEIEVLYSTSNAGAIMSKQIVRTIRAMCKKEINLGDLKLY